MLSIAAVACNDASSSDGAGTGGTVATGAAAGTNGMNGVASAAGSSNSGGGSGSGSSGGDNASGIGGSTHADGGSNAGGTSSEGGMSAGTDSSGGGNASTAGAPTGGAGAGMTWVIHCGNFYAKPNDLTIHVGDTVTWLRDDGEHFIVSAKVADGGAQCTEPTADFFALSLAPCPAQTDGLGHSCAGCPSGYQAGAFCVGAHNMPFSYTFTQVGTFGYLDSRNTHCLSSIKGVIKVL